LGLADVFQNHVKRVAQRALNRHAHDEAIAVDRYLKKHGVSSYGDLKAFMARGGNEPPPLDLSRAVLLFDVLKVKEGAPLLTNEARMRELCALSPEFENRVNAAKARIDQDRALQKRLDRQVQRDASALYATGTLGDFAWNLQLRPKS
jgi:hypothetical protein